MSLTSSLYPKYKDLTTGFTFKNKLCGLPAYPTMPYQEPLLAEANYKSFVASLHLFLLQPSTIARKPLYSFSHYGKTLIVLTL